MDAKLQQMIETEKSLAAERAARWAAEGDAQLQKIGAAFMSAVTLEEIVTGFTMIEEGRFQRNSDDAMVYFYAPNEWTDARFNRVAKLMRIEKSKHSISTFIKVGREVLDESGSFESSFVWWMLPAKSS